MKINSLPKILFVFILIFSSTVFAQLGINATNAAPATNAMLDVSSSKNGILILRHTSAQRKTIA